MIIKVAVMLILLAANPSALLNLQASQQQSVTTAKRDSPVSVGEVAPDFTLEDQDGRKVTLSSARGKKPVVLVFYRGYW